MKFSNRVFVGLGAGIVFGGFCTTLGNGSKRISRHGMIELVGNGYISLLQMLVMPLVFISTGWCLYQNEIKQETWKNQ